MKTSKALQTIITQLAENHGVDLSQVGAYLKLENAGWMDLSINTIAPHQISVAHYFEMNGDLVPDPDIVFFTGYAEWVPMSYQNQIAYSESVFLKDNGRDVRAFHPRSQAALASFANMWARNLKDQNWLSRATLVKASKGEEAEVG